MSATSDVGAGGTYLIAERVGPDAEPVVDYIERQAPAYPCRKGYVLLPGPNSNSFVKWMLRHAGWDLELPPAALGWDNCGEPPGRGVAIRARPLYPF
jgi:hypothetical protein